jgi:hypothetical protein
VFPSGARECVVLRHRAPDGLLVALQPFQQDAPEVLHTCFIERERINDACERGTDHVAAADAAR